MQSEPLLLRPEEAAEVLRVGRSFIYTLIAEGRLRSIKVGRCRRIPAAELERFVAGLLTEAADGTEDA